jgi:integrase
MRKKQGRANPGSGSVYWSTAQDRFVGEISLGFDDRGKRVKKVLVGPRKDKSEDARLGLRDRLQQEQHKRPRPKRGQPHSRLALGEFLDQWMTTKTDLSESAVHNYEWAIEGHIRPGLGTIRLRDLTRENVRAFFDTLTTLGDGGRRKVYTVLRGALNYAVDEKGLIAVNPAARLKQLGKKAVPKKRKADDSWTADEVQRFLRTAQRTEYFPLFVTMIGGALGQAEAFGLKWENLDLKSGDVEIVGDLIEVEGKLIYRPETKNEFRNRKFRLPAIALRALRARHKRNKPKPSDYVFTAPEGGGLRRTTFGNRVWKPLLKKAKVRPITPHKLRKNAASFLTAKGIGPGIVHLVLGHSDYQTTAKHYLNLLDESRNQVATTFDSLFKEFA